MAARRHAHGEQPTVDRLLFGDVGLESGQHASRADERTFTREHVDLSLIAEEATETLLPLAEKRGVSIETSGDITPTTAHTRCCSR